MIWAPSMNWILSRNGVLSLISYLFSIVAVPLLTWMNQRWRLEALCPRMINRPLELLTYSTYWSLSVDASMFAIGISPSPIKKLIFSSFANARKVLEPCRVLSEEKAVHWELNLASMLFKKKKKRLDRWWERCRLNYFRSEVQEIDWVLKRIKNVVFI